jgi:hypothetical protein
MFKFAILMLETIYWLLEKIKAGDNIFVTGERNFRVLFVRVKNLFYSYKKKTFFTQRNKICSKAHACCTCLAGTCKLY